MRILLLTQFYPPIMGGIERHVKDLGAELAKRGHHVAVATLWHEGLTEVEMDGNVRIYRIRGTLQRFASLFTVERRHTPPFPDPEVVAALRRIIATEQPEIVHAHNWLIHSFLPLKLWSRAKLVMTLHDCELTCVQLRLMYRDAELCSGPGLTKCVHCASHHYGVIKGLVTLAGNWTFSHLERARVDMFLPVSNAVAEANQLINSLPYQVIPNFISDPAADADSKLDVRIAELPENGFILQVGDMALDKGVGVLLKAYSELESAPPLILVGRNLPETPASLPNGVTMIESLPHADVMQAWKKSLFGTVPSLCMDASPSVTLEAMASGKPVIGSQIGGITDQIVDGETGFLIPPGDVTALRNAMKRLIGNPDLRSRMGAAAKEKALDFTASRVIARIENVYEQLLRKNH
jgi:glycosyltransferase involved in cell wall biosynthesis